MQKIICIVSVLMLLTGCVGSKWPTVQNKTIVLGLEVESMGSIASGETPLPKLRAGLIFHEGQIVPPGEEAKLTSNYENVNLWTASGTMKGEMSAKDNK